jgi:transcriptional regulator with XRE-family HTH domain
MVVLLGRGENFLDYKEIGEIIKELRREKKISAKQLAEELSFTVSKIRNIENGIVKTNIEDLQKICDYLGYPFDKISTPKIQLKIVENKLDPAQVGESIRHYRKIKGLTLKNLADSDLFSVGKLSNIENGLVPVDIDDIQAICDYLEIPLEIVIDPNRDKKLEQLRLDIHKAQTFIILGLFTSAKSFLNTIEKEIEQSKFTQLSFYLNYVWGMFYLETKEYDLSETLFHKVLNAERDSNDENDKIKLQAVNALCFLSFVQNKYGSAVDYCKEAKGIIFNSQKNLPSTEMGIDKIYAYFNHALCMCAYGSYEISMRLSIDVQEKSIPENLAKKITFIQGINLMLQKDYIKAEKHFHDCIEYYTRDRDIPNLLKVFQCLCFLSKCQNKKINPINCTAPNEILTESNYRDEKMAAVYLEFKQYVISVAIEEEDYALADKLLVQCREATKAFPCLSLHYKTYYYSALLNRKTTNDPEKQKFHFQKALKFLTDDNNIVRALILHELAKLNNYQNDPYLVESNKILAEFYKKDYRDLEIIKHVLPKPYY